MHGSDVLTASVQNGLAGFYLVAFLLNAGFTAYQYFSRRDMRQTLIWGIVSAVFLLHALMYVVLPAGSAPVLPHSVRDFTTWLLGLDGGQMGPILYVSTSILAFCLLLYYRK